MEKRRGLAWALGLILLAGCAGGTDSPRPLSIANEDRVIASVRHGLRNHARTVTVTFSHGGDVLDELTAMAEDWMEAALAETEDPAEGDYIRYQTGGFRLSCRRERAAEGYDYTVEVTPEYYAYLVQEEAASEKLREIMEGFAFTEETPDYERIREIYAYVRAHVRYDRVHRKNPYYHLKSTAYAALIMGAATCQGYSVLLYRMLREAGIPCRIVTGTARGAGTEEYHAWNFAQLDGLWYVLDATWDAGREEPEYFLRGADGLADHVPDAAFQTPEFQTRYPMAREDFPPP